jgi:hypothetical protein
MGAPWHTFEFVEKGPWVVVLTQVEAPAAELGDTGTQDRQEQRNQYTPQSNGHG